jgi:hypothetical protein
MDDTQSIHVLLIEDNPGDALLIREYLAEAGGGTLQLVDGGSTFHGTRNAGPGRD